MAYRLDIKDMTVSLGDAERRFTLQTGAWSVAPGEVIAFTGASGTGKTLLLELLGLLRQPDSGAYQAATSDGEKDPVLQFDGFWTSGRALSLCAAARARFFGFVPQAGGLLPFLTVAENVNLTQRIADRIDSVWAGQLMRDLGLEEIGHLRPSALSIGQRQRVAIARALAHRPFCVIADEPTAALDPGSAQTAMALLVEAAARGGTATILSSHDAQTLDKFDCRRMELGLTSATGSRDVVSSVVSMQPARNPESTVV